ncbi:MAG: hypothetical protein ACPIOQ_00665, partial [Promethearchaeia archaeon]
PPKSLPVRNSRKHSPRNENSPPCDCISRTRGGGDEDKTSRGQVVRRVKSSGGARAVHHFDTSGSLSVLQTSPLKLQGVIRVSLSAHYGV